MSENTNFTFGGRALRRSSSDQMLTGVLGGVSESFGWNSTWVRLLFMATFLLPGSQFFLVVAYIAAAAIIPKS